MSGGHFDYFYSVLDDFADKIYQKYTPEEKELSLLLKDLAIVLHDLEWWKSGDISEEDFKESYTKFKDKWIKIFLKSPDNKDTMAKLVDTIKL